MTDLLRMGKQSTRAVDHHLCSIYSCKMLQAEREAFQPGGSRLKRGDTFATHHCRESIITSRIKAYTANRGDCLLGAVARPAGRIIPFDAPIQRKAGERRGIKQRYPETQARMLKEP